MVRASDFPVGKGRQGLLEQPPIDRGAQAPEPDHRGQLQAVAPAARAREARDFVDCATLAWTGSAK